MPVHANYCGSIIQTENRGRLAEIDGVEPAQLFSMINYWEQQLGPRVSDSDSRDAIWLEVDATRSICLLYEI